MKKILYSLLIFVSIFFVVDKVSAFGEEVGTIGTMSVTATEIAEDVNYTLSNTISSDNVNYEYINNFISNEVYKEYGDYYICVGNNTSITHNCYVSDNPEAFTLKYNSSYFGIHLSNYDDYGNEIYSVFRYRITSNSIDTTNSKYMTTRGFHVAWLAGDSRATDFVMTNVPYFIMYSSSHETIKTADGYIFNTDDIVLYKNGNNFVVNTDYKTSLTPEPNIFEEEIDDIDYSKMIFEFDIDVFKERGNIFDYLIDFESIGTIQEDMSLNESHIQKFSSPYIEYVDENGIVRKLEIDFGYDDQTETRSAWYVAQNQEISSDISSLKLILPMDKTAYSRYKINFVSYIPFTISYVTNDEALSYYANVDLTNKYGVMFMPKLVENNSDISSIFYTTGIESILVYSSYDLKEEPIAIYDSNLSEFNYTISYENINYNLFFKVNSLTPELGIVTYDTRYYTYEVVDSKYSIGSVTNPNTGESNYIDFSNTANTSVNFESMSDVFEFIASNFDKNNEAYILFSDSLNVFFNTMPTDIYIFILTLLVIILIGTGLALGGWK